ncbi:type I secretion system permease/ATPase [Methylorubrum populi]|uniref:Type I secretion system ATPase PrtD n=1 Tax=Methylorubrum populi TaxID=223967 RepID=A0A833J728_9HYPH|nr:type I secretion system permease/ATPase [Methylorubrum populi]KAB7785424.1 Type I secretion system ATPase PrtD [Methylorubrum populi]
MTSALLDARLDRTTEIEPSGPPRGGERRLTSGLRGLDALYKVLAGRNYIGPADVSAAGRSPDPAPATAPRPADSPAASPESLRVADAQTAPPAARAEPVPAEPPPPSRTQPVIAPGKGTTPPSGDGGGGGGGGGGAPLQRRFGDRGFRETLTKGLSACRRKLIVIAIFSFWVNTLVLGVPIYLFNISDRVLTSRSFDTLIMLTVVIVGAIFGHVVLDMVRRFMLMRVAVEVESRLGPPVLAAAAKASQAGSNRDFQTVADLQQLRNFITGPVLLVMFDAPVAPVYVLAIFLIHPDLGWIVCATGVVLLALAFINQRVTAVPFAQASAYSTRANIQSDAMARNSQVINAMGMIPESVMIWGRDTGESLKAQVTGQDRNIVIAGLSKFVRLSTQILMLGWGASLALDGKLTGGMMIAASIISGRALAPIEGVIDGWRSYVQARMAYVRVKALLQSSPLNLERLRLPRPTGRLSVERVLYVPPPNKKVLLNGVSFTLDPGESLAIVGSSGTGKSTLGRMLVGSIMPTAGAVRLDMMDLRNWDPRQFGQSVGYLPQDVQLFPASIKANIARMQEDAADADVYDAAELADVHELVSGFTAGYETVVGMDGSPLSGGQRQRIGLARAFFGDPRLVVLDEPNSNLDTLGEVALGRALARAKQRGTTVVAITQRPALLHSVDKIMILKDGAVQAIGPRDEMIPLIVGKGAAPTTV